MLISLFKKSPKLSFSGPDRWILQRPVMWKVLQVMKSSWNGKLFYWFQWQLTSSRPTPDPLAPVEAQFDQKPILLTIFPSKIKFNENICYILITGTQIATNFCTCHDSTAVLPSAKFCNDHYIRIWIRAKWFSIYFNYARKTLVKWTLGQQCVNRAYELCLNCPSW